MKQKVHIHHASVSELRRDIVSGDWVVFAPGRFTGGHGLSRLLANRKSAHSLDASIAKCPFEEFEGEPILMRTNAYDWSLKVIQNKYPAFTHRDACAERFSYGPHTYIEGIGYHELLITRHHSRDFPDISEKEACEIFEAFTERYHAFINDKCLAYALFFHNQGTRAGASVHHPHYQIVGTPVLPRHITHSLQGSLWYKNHFGTCVHCTMIAFEKKERVRIITETREAIAYAPYASKLPFEMRVFPKKHIPYFEETSAKVRDAVVILLRDVLRKMNRALRRPDYNFFLHTAPLKNKEKHSSYHWHIEIVPRLGIEGGFELGTGMDINPVDPAIVASLLKKAKK